MIICKNCDNKFDERFGVCPKCGAPIPQNIQQGRYSYATPAQMSISSEEVVVPTKNGKGRLITIISISALIIIGVVIALIMLFSQPASRSQLDEQISLGEKYFTEENYEEAIVAFKKAIEIEPNNPELYIKLADVYIAKGDNDSAIKTLENGYELTKDDDIKKKLDEMKADVEFSKLMSEGKKALSDKNYDKAVTTFEQAIELKPTEPKPYISAADAYIGKDDDDSAKKILENGYDKTKSEEIKSKLDNLTKKLNFAKYEKLYQEYVKSDAWRSYEMPSVNSTESNNERLVLQYTEIFDFDNDGIPEMLLYAYNPNPTYRVETHSLLCTIKDNKVVTVLSGSTCGGSAGGDYVKVMYDKDENDFVIGLEGYSGGFGGTENYGKYYTYTSGSLKQFKSYSSTVYFNTFNPNYGSDTYKVDDKEVSKKEASVTEDRFAEVNHEDLPLLFDSPDTEERIKEQENSTVLYSDRVQKYNGQIYYTSGRDLLHTKHYDLSYLNYKTLPNDGSMLDFIIYKDNIYYLTLDVTDAPNTKYNLLCCDLSGDNVKTIAEDVSDSFMIKKNILQFAELEYSGNFKENVYKSFDIQTGEITNAYKSNLSNRSKIEGGSVFDGGYYYYVYPEVSDDNGVSHTDERIYRRDNKTGEVKEVGSMFYQVDW